ncbi:Sugar phosphate isomerase/epimerase [Flavobacterium aquidurense]|jgi:sugar phosphate isomerase/epimerase|uniref:Xylose isomerase-like TIM barrel domain-containing protein n=1 Tax=Flavobacterium frigidimaris TaxID=262320 RepID=A0ABX4BU22_FLAFR|nr:MULTISPECIES: TIM barrel protein [Flavobacterium]OXA81051.1 hypothetical protein B0A65_04710 [Flavobacterium frigidimaris]TDW46624.1 sugar phosphate isomerase/epimerase [Flavobacterium sp. 270]SDZ59171.1 Sugar phosphate isomerase/epimerase [Flavobacterium aquidurense]
MNINFFCPRWGNEDLKWEDFFIKVKNAGFDGVEWAINKEVTRNKIKEILQTAKEYNLIMIGQHFDTQNANFEEHLENYQKWLEKVSGLDFYCINSQTGKDFFSKEQNEKIIEAAKQNELKTGISIYHETHRNKFSFAAHITAVYLKENPELKITLDASHWVNVAESYLEDQQQAMDLAILRTEHIHARIGHTEAVQVSDPFAPEWNEALEKHLFWWDAVIKRKKDNGSKMSITTEFGPVPYMPVLPYTNQPVASQWDINHKMMQFLKKRYAD